MSDPMSDILPDATSPERFSAFEAPFLRAPEGARTVFLVTAGACAGPLAAGAMLFGWRALAVTALSVLSCAAIEKAYYRVTRAPALLGRSHACLTGLLLAMTLPAFVPWYVPIIAAAFAILVGKAVFGGVGHFLWQPALVGRLAVAVLFPATVMNPSAWPLLAQNKAIFGDVAQAKRSAVYRQWQGTPAPQGADAFALPHPTAELSSLTRGAEPAYSGLIFPGDWPRAKPTALAALPPIGEMLYGARPGGIGETCIILILVAGLYLVYRNYVKWQLPLAMLAGAWAVAAVAPIRLAGPNNTIETVWWPLLGHHLAGRCDADLCVQVGFTYVNYQLLGGELFLAAFFLAPEMTTRPVTTGGQVLFALGCGVLGMLLQLYFETPIPFYLAVLAMNTAVPTIDALWRPRVLGARRFAFLRRA
ncbi:MAG TPA: hypothetical protein DCX07_05850 [Phycisphaerales bacterium]|nr:hypothetical protein [Phycisphaerales bacterium]